MATLGAGNFASSGSGSPAPGTGNPAGRTAGQGYQAVFGAPPAGRVECRAGSVLIFLVITGGITAVMLITDEN